MESAQFKVLSAAEETPFHLPEILTEAWTVSGGSQVVWSFCSLLFVLPSVHVPPSSVRSPCGHDFSVLLSEFLSFSTLPQHLPFLLPHCWAFPFPPRRSPARCWLPFPCSILPAILHPCNLGCFQPLPWELAGEIGGFAPHRQQPGACLSRGLADGPETRGLR